jgi:hypothetical protein
MEPLKPIAGQDFSVHPPTTTFTKADGTTATAKDFLCAELPVIIDGLNAASALSKNFIVKMCIGIVVSAIQALGAAFCNVP